MIIILILLLYYYYINYNNNLLDYLWMMMRQWKAMNLWTENSQMRSRNRIKLFMRKNMRMMKKVLIINQNRMINKILFKSHRLIVLNKNKCKSKNKNNNKNNNNKNRNNRKIRRRKIRKIKMKMGLILMKRYLIFEVLFKKN